MTATRGRRSLRLTVALGLVAVALLPSATPVHAVLGLDVNPDSGYRGSTLAATATGFVPPPGEVTFWWDVSVPLGVDPSIDRGTATLKFKIPSDASFGTHVVRACHGSSCVPGQYVEAEVSVIRRPRPTPTPESTPKPTTTAGPTHASATPSPAATSAPTPAPTPAPPPTTGLESAPPLAVPTQPPVTTPPIPPILVGAQTLPPPPDGLIVPTPDEFPDLIVTDVEVTQGIQNLENAMPLVAGRRTYVRVYVRVVGAETWGGTFGGLHGSRDGQSLGWIWPEDGAIVARADGGNRLDLDDTLDFRLPDSWTDGDVKLTAFVYSYDPETPFDAEPNDFNNIRDVVVTFHAGEPLTIHYAALHLHSMYHGAQPAVEFGPNVLSILGPLVRTSNGFLRYHPIADAHIYVEPNVVLPSGHYQGHEFNIGWCTTTISQADTPGHFYLEDWTVLVEEPDPDEEGLIPIDGEHLWIDGIEYWISSAYVADDGQAQVFAGTFTLVTEPWPVGTEVMVEGCKLPGGYHEPNLTLGLWRAYHDWDDEREAFVGMVDPSLPGRFGGLSTGGTDTVWVRMSDELFSWRHEAASIAVHEIAHAAGLKHTPCLDADSDGVPDELKGGGLDLTHPEAEDFPECSLADEDPEGFMGFDVYWDYYAFDGPTVLSNDPTVGIPNLAFPFMSYAFFTWSDPYHYCRLLPYYGVPCDPDEVGIRWNHPVTPCPDCEPFTIPAPALPSDIEPTVLLLGGMIDPSIGMPDLPSFDPPGFQQVVPLVTPTTRVLERIAAQQLLDDVAAAAWIVIRDGDGREMRRVPVDAHEFAHDVEAGEPHPFTAYVGLPEGARRIDLVDLAGVTIDGMDVSEGAPEVASLFLETDFGETGAGVRIGWRAIDPDGDPLVYTVLYSPDGEKWQVIAPELLEQELRLESVAGLPGSGAGRFRVIASDGILADYADSASLEVPGSAPQPLIQFPPDGAIFPVQGTVILEGTAFDLEDRGLQGSALTWSSSLDGELGAGTEVRIATLSAGRHEITLEATDSDGMSASVAIAIEVDSSVVQAVPGSDTVTAMDRIFERLAADLDPAPGVDAHPDFLWIPLAVGGAILLTVALGAGIWLRGFRATRAAHAGLTVGGSQTVSVGAAQAESAPESTPRLVAHEASQTQQVGPEGGADADDSSNWLGTGQLSAGGSMDPGGGGLNDPSMDDAAGKAAADGGKDVQVKGSKIGES